MIAPVRELPSETQRFNIAFSAEELEQLQSLAQRDPSLSIGHLLRDAIRLHQPIAPIPPTRTPSPRASAKRTPYSQRILETLARHPHVLHGYQLLEMLGMKSGTLYPLLNKLEQQGLIETTQEDIQPQVVGRPARKLIALTEAGQKVVRSRRQERGAS